jgi:hypothetical protein
MIWSMPRTHLCPKKLDLATFSTFLTVDQENIVKIHISHHAVACLNDGTYFGSVLAVFAKMVWLTHFKAKTYYRT